MTGLALAIDIGGTNIKAGLIDLNGDLLSVERAATPSPSLPENIVQLTVNLVRQLLSQHALTLEDVDGLGISLAGFITADGVVTATAHLDRSWIGYDLRTRLSWDLETKYYFALDTVAPTLGEAYFGAGKGLDHFAYVTVSTGIGAGIMAYGRYFTGGLGWAGGVGHIIIDEHSPRVCSGCGNHGCLETFAATQGIIATALEAAAQYPDSLIAARSSQEELTPRLVFEVAKTGDVAAQQVWQQVGHALGIGLTNLVDIVSPSRIVVGGGIAQAGDLLLEPARAVIRDRAFPPQHRQAELIQATLGDLSGAYGAAAMVFHDLRINTEKA